MGKKNKGGLDGTRLILGGYDREMERFGIKGMQHGRTDRGTGEYRSEKDVEKDMINAARNDYDLRRSLEAAAMSGKGKAKQILDRGFKNAGDITNAINFSEKAAKRHGQGGNFSSASDYMGLTQSMVERDRRKQTESYDAKYATNDALQDALDKVKSGGTQDSKPPEKSDQTLQYEADVKNWEDNYSSGGIYGKQDKQKEANDFLSAYKTDLFQDKAALTPEIG